MTSKVLISCANETTKKQIFNYNFKLFAAYIPQNVFMQAVISIMLLNILTHIKLFTNSIYTFRILMQACDMCTNTMLYTAKCCSYCTRKWHPSILSSPRKECIYCRHICLMLWEENVCLCIFLWDLIIFLLPQVVLVSIFLMQLSIMFPADHINRML